MCAIVRTNDSCVHRCACAVHTSRVSVRTLIGFRFALVVRSSFPYIAMLAQAVHYAQASAKSLASAERVAMPACFSKLALPYGIGEDYRIEIAEHHAGQRPRRGMPAIHAPSADDEIMMFPDYGTVRHVQGDRPFRRIRVLLHAGYFSQSRFDKYVREYTAGQLVRLQAHHSYVIDCYESDRLEHPWLFRVAKAVKTAKVSRETFLALLDLLNYDKLCMRSGPR